MNDNDDELDEIFIRFKLIKCPGISYPVWVAQSTEESLPDNARNMWGWGYNGEGALMDLIEQWCNAVNVTVS